MLRLAALLVLLATAPVLAAPPCDVVIARAPDAVRAEIEKWVAAEARCAVSLEVRVVETAGGLYVVVRDSHGFTRERVVPDAATVGALVASWAADDSIDGVWLPVAPPAAPAVAPVVTPPTRAPSDAVWQVAQRTARSTGRLRGIGIAMVVGGAVALAGGIYSGVRAREISDEINGHDPSLPWPENIAELEARGQSYERRELGLYVAGGALVIGGGAVYLVGRSRDREQRVAVTPTASARSVGVAFSGRF
jgi:hypothetical protein